MQGCRERGGVYIQRIEKSTTLDQVWHGFMAPEPPWFWWFGAAKVCKAATPSPAAGLTPTVSLRTHQRCGGLDEGGVRIGQPVSQVVTLQVHLSTCQKPQPNGFALRAMCSRSCCAAMPHTGWQTRNNNSLREWLKAHLEIQKG